MKSLLLLLIPLCLLAPAANAKDDGHTLYKHCKSAATFLETKSTNDELGSAYCLGLIKGVSESLAIMQDEAKKKFNICISKDKLSIELSVQLVIGFMDKMPDVKKDSAVAVAMAAHVVAYECGGFLNRSLEK